MLVLKRKRGEVIEIGPNISVQVLEIAADGSVSLGIVAPKHLNVIRRELRERLEGQGVPVYTEKKR